MLADFKYNEAAPGPGRASAAVAAAAKAAKPGVYQGPDGSAVAVSYQSDDPGYNSGANYGVNGGVSGGGGSGVGGGVSAELARRSFEAELGGAGLPAAPTAAHVWHLWDECC